MHDFSVLQQFIYQRVLKISFLTLNVLFSECFGAILYFQKQSLKDLLLSG